MGDAAGDAVGDTVEVAGSVKVEAIVAVATDAVSVAVTPYYTNGTGPITCCFCLICQKPFISVFPYV